MKRDRVITLLLVFCVSILLVARGWLTWQWDSPIRGLFWQEDWWTPIVNWAGLSWSDYANQSDSAITTILTSVGIVLILGGLLSWLTLRYRFLAWLLIPFSLVLVIDAIGRLVQNDYQLAVSLEQSMQWGAPLVLLWWLRVKEPSHRWVLFVSILTACTFIGHGLFAMGFHPVPLKFQYMTGQILGVGEELTFLFLKIAGWLDILVSLGIFIPKIRRPCLYYMVLWGGATALARIMSHSALDPWLIETLVRSPHWILPLVLLIHKPKQSN